MTENILAEVRSVGSLKNAIIGSVCLTEQTSSVTVRLITDSAYSQNDYDRAYKMVRKYVPDEFSLKLQISKLTPDCEMVRERILALIREKFPALSAVADKNSVNVEKGDEGFNFTLGVIGGQSRAEGVLRTVEEELKKSFCGTFCGKIAKERLSAENIVIDERIEEESFVAPVRTFAVENFSPIESADAPSRALYTEDFNFISENAVVCGKIIDISERSYIRSNGEEKPYFVITLTDGTGTLRMTYFARKKSLDKIRELKAGESIVCSCKSEVYGGSLRYTATRIDYGEPPKKFVPIKRATRPVPRFYHTVTPQPFSDFTQSDFFTDDTLPACFKGTTFVVFDLETTGLCTIPVVGEMDGIIEIGAYKVVDGEIKEKFSTFVNPERAALDARITELTGITDAMVKAAPSYKEVLPDFVKFCDGAALVGHNAVGFDYKFIDFYCGELGFKLNGNVMDTLFLSQQLLRLSNYKLNTVAEHFGITFNHHRAEDDALATAKIFIELIKLKKSF